MVQFRPLFPELRDFEKNGTRHFFRSAAILKVLVRPNWVSNLSEPWVKESRHVHFGAIQAIFRQLSWSQHEREREREREREGGREGGRERERERSETACKIEGLPPHVLEQELYKLCCSTDVSKDHEILETLHNWSPFDCYNRGYVALGLSNASYRYIYSNTMTNPKEWTREGEEWTGNARAISPTKRIIQDPKSMHELHDNLYYSELIYLGLWLGSV